MHLWRARDNVSGQCLLKLCCIDKEPKALKAESIDGFHEWRRAWWGSRGCAHTARRTSAEHSVRWRLRVTQSGAVHSTFCRRGCANRTSRAGNLKIKKKLTITFSIIIYIFLLSVITRCAWLSLLWLWCTFFIVQYRSQGMLF